MRRLSSGYRVPARAFSSPSLRSCIGVAPFIQATTERSTRWLRTDLTANKSDLFNVANQASCYSTAAEVRPLEEVPAITIQDIMELGGFQKVLELSDNINKRYGPLVRSHLQGVNSVWIMNPDDISTVMQKEGKWPIGGATVVWPLALIFKQHGVKSVAFAQGEEWKRLRTAFQKHLFAPLDAESYAPCNTCRGRRIEGHQKPSIPHGCLPSYRYP